MKIDFADPGVYGTYGKGGDEEGEYGDGDKVYFSDSHVYYGVNDENQGKDRNSNYGDD